MTTVIGINGSPRKTWNTATLLGHALKGAASSGAETELVHLYDLDFKGCTSCFACKMKGGKSYGRCAVCDDLAPVLDRIGGADGLILGSPIYFGTVSGEMRSFMERLLFPYLIYTRPPRSLFHGRGRAAFIYTMNAPEAVARENYAAHIRENRSALERLFGRTESLCSFETLQFEDYDMVDSGYFDPEERRERYRTVFPEDCRRAFELGVRLAGGC
ncbi:flavodoxin family protein [Methanoculleus sp. Wushi-C6]|uniref:Flavodoxin family protein n=1 Tax=Methanoculleus caldifontis TaxID=2651577 RepID=A0ABU3X1F6_9EURY|nr:flavodoxin family protein [Methanoculleus sp. Wushi-C6]MDV2481867.1 flavodoxin family protein [Methanoculleus sp. Wushi-C6]